MNAPINHQLIKNQHGVAEYVVVPIEDYLALIQKPTIDLKHGVPSEVVNLVFVKNYSPIKAWREHLGLTQAEVAKKIGVSQSAYSQFENAEHLQKQTLKKIATALGLTVEQLDF